MTIATGDAAGAAAPASEPAAVQADAAQSGGALSAGRSPRLLIVAPCLDEEAHLPGLLERLTRDPAAADALIVVADGGSTDRSVEIVERRAAADPRVRLLRNPKRIQSAAVNLAARTFGADADFLLRVDVHAGYPEDFVARLLAAAAETGADTVTVSMVARSPSGACFQVAVAAAQNSRLGAGGSPHRSAGGRRWVDHGHHALFRMAAFRRAGGYDESFSHNEDAELDARILSAGGRILLEGGVAIDYYPRATARALARQYFNFGRGRARMLLLHRKAPKLRQLAPPMVLPAAVLALAAPWLAPWSLALAAPAAAWLALCLGYGLVLGARARSLCAMGAGIAAAIMHVAWAAGFWAQLLGGGARSRAAAGSTA